LSTPTGAASTWAWATKPCCATPRPSSRTARWGDDYDNAQAESLWSRLKTELLELRDWPGFIDLADAQTSVADYFDYYNHKRRHSSIGCLKPYHFHQQLLANITQLSPV
jgi:putative transposase